MTLKLNKYIFNKILVKYLKTSYVILQKDSDDIIVSMLVSAICIARSGSGYAGW